MIALLSLASFSTLAFGSKTDHSNLVMTDGRWSSKAQAPTPVPEVELLRYSGRWYQVYSDLASNTFESKYCVVADYGIFANNTISVRNRDRLDNVTGEQNGILGWGGINNRTGLNTVRGDLTVNLQIPGSRGPPFPAPYDVILLGPSTFGEFGQYEYAVVSDFLELTLFVLARNYTDFFDKYNKTVIETLEADGYVRIINTPKPTVYEGCAEYSETDLWSCDVHDIDLPAPSSS